MRSFSVPGKPIGKGRPRVTTFAGHARQYSPAKTVNYESKVAYGYREKYPGEDPYPAGIPIGVSIVARFAIPKSWSQKRKAETVYHTGKPDADNICKAICDALNGIAWHDDSQVVSVSVVKVYSADGGERVDVSMWRK